MKFVLRVILEKLKESELMLGFIFFTYYENIVILIFLKVILIIIVLY